MASVACAFCADSASAVEPLGGLTKGVAKLLGRGENVARRDRPAMGTNPTVENLANQIDWLEHHLDSFGSVVPKQPDVWGEARLTTHRQEIECQLRDRLNKFDSNLQASLRRTDLADLSLSIALGFATDGRAVPQASIVAGSGTAAKEETKEETTTDADGRTMTKVTKTTSPASPEAVAGLSNSVSCNGMASDSSAIDLEPTLHNDQLYRYLQALNELRRINEGDDNSDSPGYSLNVVRLPISILPGKHTQSGYGGEITFTAEPNLGPDLLPDTFRNLVINDLVDQLSLPMTRLLNNDLAKGLKMISIQARAEAEADRITEAMEKRLRCLAEKPGFESPVEHFNEYFEYLRNRFSELSALSSYAASLRDEGRVGGNPETDNDIDKIVIADSSFKLSDGKAVRLIATVRCRQLLETIEELLQFGVSVTRLSLSIDVEKESMALEVPILCLEMDEQTLAAEYIKGSMPYSFCIDYRGLIDENIVCEENIDIQSLDFLIRADALISQSPPKQMESFKKRRKVDPIVSGSIKKAVTSPSSVKDVPSSKELAREAISSTVGKLKVIIEEVVSGDTKRKFANEILDRLQGNNYRDFLSVFAENKTIENRLYSQGGASIPAPARQRRSMQPLAPSQLVEVFGTEMLLRIAERLVRSLQALPPNDGNYVHLIDVRRLLFEELSSSYDFLSQPDLLPAWQFAGPELTRAITSRNLAEVRRMRREFNAGFSRGVKTNIAASLSWAIMVESSLLNDHLTFEMQRLSGDKGCACCPPEFPIFYGPTPAQDAREAFNQYVMCRWPIQVFALDPTTQDQNVKESFDMRRNLQLAAAVAVAQGRANINAAGRFVRNLELGIDTTTLNRTAVGFSHGSNTFGWRFYPRVQTPDTPSTLAAFGQTLLGGPNKAALLRDRELEPGIRECTAIVVMPSFVPYLTIHSRSSWFHLNNPGARQLTMHDAMQLSAACEAVQRFTNRSLDGRCYRPGDVTGLTIAANQLNERLPIRSQVIPVPFENSLGGFEMFSSGASDLSVELLGWYGAPGIDPGCETTLFLVGKGFSVHKTVVIAGGKEITPVLLSREIMQIKVPAKSRALSYGEDPTLVDLHVATPYGVSSHLLIPQIKKKVYPPATQPAINTATWITKTVEMNGTVFSSDKKTVIADLTFSAGVSPSFTMTPKPLTPPVVLVGELLTSTPAGIGWAPEFKKPIELKITTGPSETLQIGPAEIASLRTDIEAALNRGLEFAPNQREWRLFLRGAVNQNSGTVAIDRDIRIEVRLADPLPAPVPEEASRINLNGQMNGLRIR
jgi:hypothetical protein